MRLEYCLRAKSPWGFRRTNRSELFADLGVLEVEGSNLLCYFFFFFLPFGFHVSGDDHGSCF